jgi:hypothetical protein
LAHLAALVSTVHFASPAWHFAIPAAGIFFAAIPEP